MEIQLNNKTLFKFSFTYDIGKNTVTVNGDGTTQESQVTKDELAELERQLTEEQDNNKALTSKLSYLRMSLDDMASNIKNLTNEIVTLRDKVIPTPVVTYDKTSIELVEELRRFPVVTYSCGMCRMIPYGILEDEDIVKKNKTDN